MNSYGYQQYKQQSVNTMTSGEMLIVLYDEALKRLSRSEIALKDKDYVTFDISIDRVSEIIKYLNSTLDKSYAISAELKRLYDFFLFHLVRIKAGRNTKLITEIRPLILNLRNSFKEADKISIGKK
ncbi:MAG TPA: flagellar export chaperone FliS [Lachnospiraceae bacterium]|jgi:flagellar biosynthetic protein FliS|nr:flagellar export chaperone FliS [Lachnospiraceae bacterium]